MKIAFAIPETEKGETFATVEKFAKDNDYILEKDYDGEFSLEQLATWLPLAGWSHGLDELHRQGGCMLLKKSPPKPDPSRSDSLTGSKVQ